MAKLALTDIAAGYLSLSVYNANNTLLEAALENTLSRDGTSPNTMSANLDMNSNRVVNIVDAENNQEAVSLAQLTAATVVASSITAALVSLADSGANYAASTAEAAFTELADSTGAAIIGVLDSGGYFAGTDVETILADIGNNYVKLSTANTWPLIQTFDKAIFIKEAANALSDVADYGQFWIKTVTPNQAWFTNDAGTDARLIVSVVHMAEAVLSGIILKDFGIKSTVLTSTSGVIAIDLENGNAFEHVLDENLTSVTISNPVTTGLYCEFILKFRQDGTGSRTVTGYPASVKWAGGVEPTITTTLTTGVDILTFKTWDAGTTWYADISQDYS